MSTVAEIKQAISQLSSPDRAVLRDWLLKSDAEEWDREFEADVTAGRLDWLREEAKQDLREGRCTDR